MAAAISNEARLMPKKRLVDKTFLELRLPRHWSADLAVVGPIPEGRVLVRRLGQKTKSDRRD
jgi:hypothetical protein